MRKIRAILWLVVSGLAVCTLSARADVMALYQQSCATCHDSGAFNAPQRGDRPSWQTLLAQKGMDQLVNSAKKGTLQMPAKGLCHTCSDEQFVQLIEYMSQ